MTADARIFTPADPERFAAAISRFDQANARDPNLAQTAEGLRPKELVYAEWLTAWVLRLCPHATERLRLATRAQHLCRWEIPRSSYPMTRAGYLRWRAELKKFHATRASEILSELSYPNDFIKGVQDLILKRNFPQDAEARVLEDALCLVFLDHQFAELASKTPEAKMVPAVVKTWNKMTPAARELARQIPLGPREKALLAKALAGAELNHESK